MLSHLRFHRRGTSNPTSPAPDQGSPSSFSNHQSPITSDAISPQDTQWPTSASSSLPPTLPPIPRVTSTGLDPRPDERLDADISLQLESRLQQQTSRSNYDTDSGFIGGVALRNYQRGAEVYQGDHVNHAGRHDTQSRAQLSSPISLNADPALKVSSQSSGNAKSQTSIGVTNRQLTSFATSSQLHFATRQISEPLPISNNIPVVEPQRGKRTLPFLKNPMSTLLLRRKANQIPPSILPNPLNSNLEEPSYDPRIRGTRVHDFSAPRHRTNGPANDTVAIRSASRSNLAAEPGVGPSPVLENRDETRQRNPHRHMSSVSDPARTESVNKSSQPIVQSSSISSAKTDSFSADQIGPLGDHNAPPVPPKDEASDSALQASESTASRMTAQETEILSRSIGSARISRSRNVSLSSIPKHMKSTSSRFSFDMIGAAKQEKILEERHRQRELDKKTTMDDSGDPRFDDFDEDAFDYDAMMDDDGLEERIPGVNADFDEDSYLDGQYLDDQHLNGNYEDNYGDDQVIGDEADPDNDQENFAGFVFQRSNPASSLTSPQAGDSLATPRDAEGKIIGFAMTKETPNLAMLQSPSEPNASSLNYEADTQVSGLGIQNMDMVNSSKASGAGNELASPPSPTTTSHAMGGDDLYFDDGVTGFEDEFAEDLAAPPDIDGVPFDESIFDNDDTDQFGRPVPGAFAMAKSMRKESHQPSVKRESDIMSGASALSGASQSTAHTSLSVDAEHSSNCETVKVPEMAPLPTENSIVSPQPTTYSGGAVAAYQAALAAAANDAADSGKFQWSPSLSQNNQGEQSESFVHKTASDVHENNMNNDYDYDYGYSYDDMDDFEADDDAIIAEANASALANDSDGWYGQEFGFYAGPINQHGPQYDPGTESYGYANGGFFGPKGANGLNRSTSGHVVSREPNLTPITERSEYSNRNSIMSLGIPPISGTPSVQSPGLAQLAMMADRGDDQMTLSALLRLRSRAWGGSQASLASSKDGSPRSERGDTPGSPRATSFSNAFPSSNSGHTRKNSVFSVVSRDSDAGSAPGSPTMTFAMPAVANVPPAESWPSHVWGGNPSSNDLQNMPASTGFVAGSNDPSGQDGTVSAASYQRANKGHQRQKGSSDSISYMKEEESGETRWVMERRRTGEYGEIEILEREVVEGGRI